MLFPCVITATFLFRALETGKNKDGRQAESMAGKKWGKRLDFELKNGAPGGI